MTTPANSPSEESEPTPKAPPPHGAPPSEEPEPAAPRQHSGDDQNLGTLAHLLALFTFFVGPLALWLMFRGRSSYIEKQALEALNFQILVAIAFFVSGILTVVVIGIILIPLTLLAHAAFTLIATVKASDGVVYEYPFSLRLIK